MWLVTLFHNKDTTVEALTEIVKCFGNMAVLQENRQKIYESNIMPIAIRLIKMKVDDELKANLTLLFANMSGYGMFIIALYSRSNFTRRNVQSTVDQRWSD